MIKKIYQNRLLILQTIYFLYKYMIMRAFLSDKLFLKKLSAQSSIQNHYMATMYPEQPFYPLLSSINKILSFLYANGNCLIKSLVKRDLLKLYGYTEKIAVGVLTTDTGIKAHAWLSGEYESKFKIVHLL